jgi:hypothetical protein
MRHCIPIVIIDVVVILDFALNRAMINTRNGRTESEDTNDGRRRAKRKSHADVGAHLGRISPDRETHTREREASVSYCLRSVRATPVHDLASKNLPKKRNRCLVQQVNCLPTAW